MVTKFVKKFESQIKYLLIVYVAIQPLLEIVLNLWPELLSVAGVSLATLVRYALLMVLVLATVVLGYPRKSTKLFIGYLIAVGIFILLQWINVKDFSLMIMDVSMQKNLLETLLYISRYAIPVVLIYEVYTLRFCVKDLQRTVIFVVLFVSLGMLVANLSGTDTISYSFDDLSRPTGSVLDWFGDPSGEAWKQYTSKGWFRSGNQLSALMALLLPVTLWMALTSKKIRYFAVVAFHLLTLLMLGTRVSAYGAILLSAGTFAIWVLQSVLEKQRPSRKSLVSFSALALVFVFVYMQSPFYFRAQSGEAGFDNLKGYVPPAQTSLAPSASQVPATTGSASSKPSGVGQTLSKEAMEKKVKQFAKDHWIPWEIISDQYRFEEHQSFWEGMVKEVDLAQRDNARDVKELILKDVVAEKGGALDWLVGIGEAPIYPEKDFSSQYYYIGIGGIVLFIVPFLGIFLWSAVLTVKALFVRRRVGLLAVLLMAGGFVYAVAIFSGHVLEPLLVNTYIAVISGVMCGLWPCQEKKKEEKIEEQMHD